MFSEDWPFALLDPTVDHAPRDIILASLNRFSGLSVSDVDALAALGLHTIYDLAHARAFTAADLALDTINGSDPKLPLPGDLIDYDTAGVPASPQDVLETALGHIKGVSRDAADILARQLGLSTIEDAASWPYFRAAKTFVRLATEVEISDHLPPSDLLPSNGRFAIQRATFTRSYVDHFGTPKTTAQPSRAAMLSAVRADVSPGMTRVAINRGRLFSGMLRGRRAAQAEVQTGSAADLSARARTVQSLTAAETDTDIGPLSLDQLADTKIPSAALGAQVTFERTMTAEGVALGRLLRSVTLAPGESVNIAVVDWTTSLSTQAQETLDQSETTDASSDQSMSNRSEERGVRREEQRQQTTVDQEAKQDNTYVDATISAEAGVAGPGYSAGIDSTLGMGANTSTNTFTQDVAVSSIGQSGMHMEALNDVVSSTQQSASAERNRRAAVVTETLQNKTSTARNRTIVNYNHMHTLSLHYYEVVQVFRMQVAGRSAKPLLFVPIEPIDFSDPDTVERHRPALALQSRGAPLGRLLQRSSYGVELRVFGSIRQGESANQVFRAQGPVRADRAAGVFRLPRGAVLRGLTFRGAHVPAEIVLGRRDQTKTETYKADIFSVSGRGSVSTVEFDRVLPLEALRALNNTFKTKPSATDVLTAELSLSVHGEEAVVEFSYQARQASYTILTAEALPIPPAVIAELNRDPIRYSMAVWRSLEPSSLMGLFVGKTFAGLDLTGAVEPRVAAVYGNMLGFPITIPEDDSPAARWWAEWKAKNFDADVQVADMVSMPTDGVHAEGVLGRANTAEKFDFTRFWDWQESPIPALAPPAAASQPAAAAPITPTAQFGAPMASLQALQTLPSSAFSGGLAEGLTTSVVDPGAMMEMAAKTAGAGIEANKAANLEVTKQSAAVRIAAMENLSKMSNARLGAMMKAEEHRASASETGPDPAKGEAAPASSSKPSKAGATPGGGPPAASSPQQTNTPAGQSPAAGRGTSADGPQTPGGAEPGPDTPAPDEGDAPPPHEDDEWRRTYEKDVGPFLIGQVALMNFQPNSIDLHPDDRAAIDALIQKHGQRLLPVSVAAEVDEAEMSSQERRIYLEKARIAGVQGALSQAGLPETRLGLALIPDTDAGPFKRRRVTLCYVVEKQPLSQATKGLNVDAEVPFEGAEVGKHYAVQAPMFDRDQYWLTEPAARIFLSNASRLRKYGATLTAPKFFFRPDDTLEGQDLYQLSAARWACYAELAVQAGFSIERVFDASGAGPTEADAASVELLFRIDRAPPSGPAPSPPGRTRKKSSSTRDPARDPMADTVSSAAGDFIEETPSEGVDRLVLLDFAKNDGRLRPLHRGVLEDFLKRIATTAGSLTVSASVSVDEAAAPDKGQSLAAQRFSAVVATAKRLNVPWPIRAPVFENKPGPVADREARSVTITFERDSEI